MEQRRELARAEVETALYILWEAGKDSVGSGKITSLSSKGCFVQTRSEPTAGHSIMIRLRLPTERWLALEGRVVHVLRRVGFGVQFTGLALVDQEMLALLVDYYREEPMVLPALLCEPEPANAK
jgi:hypothetical protein